MNFMDLKSGHSVEDSEIKCYRSEKSGERYIYLMAGVHGDEVEGVYVLQQLFKWLQDNDDIEIPAVVIPILNVDGFRSGTRVNSHGVDLNRNLDTSTWTPEAKESKYNPGPKPLSEPENQFLVKMFDKYPPGLILSIHSWKPIINYNGKCQEVAQFLANYNSYPVADDIGYPTPGSLGNFAPEKYQAPVITFECPVLKDDLTLKDIWEENRQGLEGLMASELLQSYYS